MFDCKVFSSSILIKFHFDVVIAEEKSYTHVPENAPNSACHFKAGRIYLWNKSSTPRACGLAWGGDKGLSKEDCA